MDTGYKFTSVFFFWFIIATYFKKMGNEIGDLFFYRSIFVLFAFLFVFSYTILYSCQQYNDKPMDHFGEVSLIVLKNTIIPWLIMFGSIMYLISNVSAWVSPFSNTFGYLFYKKDVNDLISQLFKQPDELSGEGNASKISLLEKLYSDTSLFFNILTPDNFESAYDNLTKENAIIKGTDEEKSEIKTEIKSQMKHYVYKKHGIGQLMWLLMAGLMAVSTTSTNYKSLDCD